MASLSSGLAGLSLTTENDELSAAHDLFLPLRADDCVEDCNDVSIRPLTLSDQGSLEFSVPALGNKYIQWWDTRLYIRAKVLKADGTNMDANAQIINPLNWTINK